ncbi:Eco57I restriction-modification methylase domain-containing protein [Rhizobium johnstonii]|uniref:Eco57I restriction-modification methylase domain-containing protein n=1 Tax=Rhizobium johnstonii TaxID=3019933 RepID=UPI003F9B9F49
MARKTITDMSAWPSLSLEGNLVAPAMIAKIDQRQAPDQTPEDYAVRKGLQIREEIATAFRVGQSHFDAFTKIEHPSAAATTRFISGLFKETFGYDDLTAASAPMALSASGRVPIVVVPPQEQIDRRSQTLSTDRSRSPAFALQDYLNVSDDALWGIVTNGMQMRLMRDNASLTRPAYIEADLAQMFTNEDIASFAVLWLLIHRSRFGAADAPATDCALERWRDAGSKEGEAARDRLADQVQIALKLLGSGFLEANPDLAAKLHSGEVNLTEWFNELLRLVYRLIFLMVAEDRNLLHPDKARPEARTLYADGYSMQSLRKQCYRAGTWDKHHDRYEGVKVVFRALTHGQPALALPALGGLFAEDRLPHLETASLRNRAFMEALYRLSWLADKNGMVPVNWRAMETEELGSVYESLLELQPQLGDDGKTLVFASEAAEQRGNQRKTTGSYYTPDSLVQALLDTALDPVLNKTESEADNPAKALLKLSVIDPACGSGHFLLAAARRIATRLARIRAEGTPSLADFRHALRDVARCCIYGVDRNPMAVELTKVALWIETVDPGLPLGFFDAQIRCGDALLGVFDLQVLQNGVPDAAYKPLTGDDKDTARYYLQANRAATSGQGGFDFGLGRASMPAMKPLALDFSGFRDLPEDSVEQIGAKAARFKELRKGQTFVRAKAAADLYVAAFLSPKVGGAPAGASERTVPTTEELWMALNQGKMRQAMVEAPKAARNARAFHWPLEFPDAMNRGGFDVVVGNPPWERVEVQEQEVFALSHPKIATAKNASQRKKMIEALKTDEPKAYRIWQEALRTAATEVNFLKESGRYPLGSPGKVNTYAVFANLFWSLGKQESFSALIIPTGLVSGYTYREFLTTLLVNKSLVSFYGFENEDLIFPHITNKVKFGILTMAGEKVEIENPWLTANIRRPSEISDPEKRYTLDLAEIRAINPNTLSLPAFRWSKDAEVTAAIHAAAPVLIEKNGNHVTRNDWSLTFKSMFNMATDSGHFIDSEEVEKLISERSASLAILRDGRRVYPLYEGKMFWLFDHRYGTYEGQTEQQSNKGVLPRVLEEQHRLPDYQIRPQYWVDAQLTDEMLGADSGKSWFFSWRDVGPSERTFVGTVVPRSAMGHASPYISTGLSSEDTLSLAAMLSTLVVDYAVRQKSSRMTFFVVEQLPMIERAKIEEEPTWLGESVRTWLNNRAIELFYTNWELEGLAHSIGMEIPPFHWDSSRRQILQAEIDAVALHLFNLDREKAEWVIDSFSVLRKYEERDYEEFQTKRLVLAAYDAMAEARAAGCVYVSPVSPPPADPSLCHNAPVSDHRHIELPPLEQLENAIWAWPYGINEHDRVRAQLRALVGILPESSDARRVRLAALACLQPALLDGFLSDADHREWQRLVAHPAKVTQLVPPTNAAWGAAFSALVSSAVLDVSTDGTLWGAGKRLDRSTLNANDPAVGRALFAWSRLEGISLDRELAQVPAVILPFIREGRLAA